MASTTIPLLTTHIPQLATLLKPTSTGDALALALVALGSASYLLKGVAWDKPDPYTSQFYKRPQLANGESLSRQKATRNIAQKLEEHSKDLVIFWGSQSGTAEGIANRLGRECHLRFGLNVLVADLSDYDPETIGLIPEAKLALFIVSTYGEGDPSDNTAGFWDWIHTKGCPLSKLRYAAFGLGNSNYKHYNRVVDITVDALDRFGAQAVMPVGKADDAGGGTEEDFMVWKARLFDVFGTLGMEEIEMRYSPIFEVAEDDSLEPIDLHDGEPTQSDSAKGCSPIRALKVAKSRELFSGSDRNCLHMDFDLSDHPDLHYKTGDHLAIWPISPEDEVETLLTVLGRSAETPITIKSLDTTIKIKIPTPTTPPAIFRHYLEICAPVSRETILSLAHFAPTEQAKTFLINLGKNKTQYSTFKSENYLTIGRVLKIACPKFAWNIPLSYFIETLPHLQPRYYSISSSSAISPRQPSITALISTTPLANRTAIPGITSNYLLALSNLTSKESTYQLAGPSGKLQDSRVFAHIRKSKFKLPAQSSCPLIMIAAGTGIAPFIAFLNQRKKLMDIGRPVGEMILFFGCRDMGDYIYRSELEGLERAFDGKLKIVVAFSRLEGERKKYVQDRILEMSDDVLGLIEGGGNVYICGRANMSKCVERVLDETMMVRKGWKDSDASDWSRKLKGMRKWQEDVWG